ncbi:MAG: hypothetical protein HYV63_07480 [Candidatus Schekmanbacteria bacterium]|nr:hypothetical protein [Candidatus Schekmanbacteria bacterium]
MPIPAIVFQAAERHSCFTGCYQYDSQIQLCIDPNLPLDRGVVAQCQDCLSYRLAVRMSDLPPGMDVYGFGQELTEHVRKLRGFSQSVGGYHARGPGFWLSAIYYAQCGVFLARGDRSVSRSGGDPQKDLDALLAGFKHGVITAADPKMLRSDQYRLHRVYVSFAQWAPVKSVHDVFASPQVRMKPASGFASATMAEYLPVASAPKGRHLTTSPTPVVGVAAAARSRAAAPAGAASPPPRKLQMGEFCPLCGERVEQRPLLYGSYVGCRC